MRIAIAFGLAIVASVTLVAQQRSAPTAKPKPDLSGTWTNATITPLERPQGVKDLVLTEDAARRMEQAVIARRDKLNEPSDPDRPAPPQGGDGSTGAAGNVGGYNNFWLDPGDRVAVVDGQRRSSLIIDPPDGHVPALTAEARQRQQARLKRLAGVGQYDHPEYRPLAERCLLSFGPTTPLVPNYFYNNNLQIVQTPDHVMILMEMVHDARIVRIGGQHVSKNIRPWMGDSVGRWEGDTLVVDVSNFNGRTWLDMAGNFVDQNEHVVERFTLSDPDTILYEATITDPTVFVKPVEMRFTLKRVPAEQQILEYSCLEGERSLQHYTSEDGGKKARVK